MNFIDRIPSGCGTGKYLQLQSDRYTIGCDRSRQLCELAREKHCQIPIVIADNLHLPYRDNLFDAVLSIGVIHHLATHERRVQAIRGGISTVDLLEKKKQTTICFHFRMSENSQT